MEKSLSELTTINVFKYIDFLIIPKREKELRILYETYKSSEDTLNLLSEQNRQLFADNLLLEEPIGVRKLYWMTIEIVAKNFNGNAKEIEKNFDLVTQDNIWELVDINLPILKTININSDIYWQRVFNTKSRNKSRIGQDKTIDDLNLSCKCLGMAEKIRSFFEDMSYEGWIDEKMIYTIKPIAQYIYYLRFTQLLPIKEYSFDRDPNLIDYRMINYNKDECHHINLEIVGELYQLTYLSFEFSPPKMGVNYESRFFDFSTLDMVHLAKGLQRLPNLKVFKIRNSRMNNKKLEILVEALKLCPLENIDFSYCQLNDECGYTLSKLFENNTTLEKMDLSGNYLCAPGMSTLSYGIQEYEGYLKHLNLARNPINNAGLTFLARAINDKNQIEILNLCGIQINEKGCALLPNILKNPTLQNINITALPIGEYLGDYIINAIDINKNVLICDADECGLTLEQELKLKILIKRNNYLHDNPYIGTEITKSKENIPDEEVHKIKNKIYLKALEKFDKHQECIKILDEKYKKNIPFVNPKILRHSLRAKELLVEGVPQILYEKPSKSGKLISLPKMYGNSNDEENDYLKRCTFSTTVNQQYFENN